MNFSLSQGSNIDQFSFFSDLELEEKLAIKKIEINDKSKSKLQYKKTEEDRKCFNCGGKWPHSGKCPAYRQECRKCGKMNHFASCCRKMKGRVRLVK